MSKELKGEYDEHDFLAACREGNKEAVQFFIDLPGFDINGRWVSGLCGKYTTGLYVATVYGHLGIVSQLLNAGADPKRGMLHFWGTINFRPITIARVSMTSENREVVGRGTYSQAIELLSSAQRRWETKSQ
ncbi:hypothetical protein E1189_03255 [Sansalvadorimonas verongulae]|nr:hypothetical protein [Sansalvadorimonas verongulae]